MANGITLGIILVIAMLVGAFLLTALINIFLVPIIKTPKNVIDEIVELMNLKKEDTFVDLGCGDGKIVLEAYENGKCKCYGLDLSPMMIIIARTLRIVRFPNNKDIVFDVENIYASPLDDFTKVYCFLDENSLNILRREFLKLVERGGGVYSYKYKVKGLVPEKKVELSNGEYLYVYEKSGGGSKGKKLKA